MAKPSIDEVRGAVDEYFTACEAKGLFPDEAGMVVSVKRKLGLKISEVKELETDEDYLEIFEEAKYLRESELVRTMTTDNKRAQGCLNALKQTKNGGYVDKTAGKKDTTVVLKVEGIGGMEAFD